MCLYVFQHHHSDDNNEEGDIISNGNDVNGSGTPAGSRNYYQLIIAGNRDEFLDRPTTAAHFWNTFSGEDQEDALNEGVNDDILAGIDLGFNPFSATLTHNATQSAPVTETTSSINQNSSNTDSTLERTELTSNANNNSSSTGGTWFGITRSGRYAFITNFHEDKAKLLPNAISRGHLVKDFLTGEPVVHESDDGKVEEHFIKSSPKDYVCKVAQRGHLYNGFNLVVGVIGGEMWYVGNRDPGKNVAVKLDPHTTHGLSNGTLISGSSWHKVKRARDLFKDTLDSHIHQQFPPISTSESSVPQDLENQLIDSLLDVLKDKQPPPEELRTDLHRHYLSVCVQHVPGEPFPFATRTHTVLLVDNNNRVRFVEVDGYYKQSMDGADNLNSQPGVAEAEQWNLEAELVKEKVQAEARGDMETAKALSESLLKKSDKGSGLPGGAPTLFVEYEGHHHKGRRDHVFQLRDSK